MEYESKAISTSIEESINFLGIVIQNRFKEYFGKNQGKRKAPALDLSSGSPLNAFILENDLTHEEIILLLLTLAPHADPIILDRLIQNSIPEAGDFPEIGGLRGKVYRGFLPTIQTAIFVIAGNDYSKKLETRRLFQRDHFFIRNQIIFIEEIPSGEPFEGSKIYLSPDYVDFFLTGVIPQPKFGVDFPAELVETKMAWDSLVLSNKVKAQLNDIILWTKNKDWINQNLSIFSRDRFGYRTLFYGPPGTGKTITAKLIGKVTNHQVYRVDLSILMSKYIGETSKTISRLFSRAAGKNWILFFDEADALFTSRTNVKDSGDRYANQEVSYLLQKLEEFSGIVIIATNHFSLIDNFSSSFVAAGLFDRSLEKYLLRYDHFALLTSNSPNSG